MALPFAADACLVASSFEADADDADDAAELADDAAAALEEAAQGTDNGPPSRTRTPRNQLRRLALYPDELMAVCDGGPCWI